MGIGRIVRELEEAGLIESIESTESSGSRGRPAFGLKLRDEGVFVVGAVISAYSQEIVLMNLGGQVIDLQAVRVEDVTNGPEVLATFCRAIKKMIRKADISDDRVVGVGFAVAASVEPKEGNVIDSGYLGWSAFDLQGSAQRTLNVPVAVNNIADALLRAEAFSGCTKNIKAVVLIHGATTLGASFLYNNELVSGAYSKSGRIGHFPVRRSKLVCSCGRSDCLNCEASGWAILNKIGLTDRPEYQHKRVQEYSEKIRALVGGRLEIGKGVKQVDQVLLKAGRSLAFGLRYLELAFDPDLLVLAGPLAEQELYFKGAMEGFQSDDSIASDTNRQLKRGTIKPNQAAGLIALLNTVFSPALDIQRLTSSSAFAREQN